MQIQMQAFAKRSRSLRKIIAEDLCNHEHEVLYVEKCLDPERAKGWGKTHGKEMPGVLNIECDPDQQMLIVRAIARKRNKPYQLLGTFMQYLMERHGGKITSINLQLR
jgi:hypothetical protein